MTANTPTQQRQRAHDVNPFDLEDDGAYGQWRERKLARSVFATPAPIVEIDEPRALSPAERDALVRGCRDRNMAIYQCARPVDKLALRRFGLQLGLEHLDHNLCADDDSVSSIESRSGGLQSGFIPYSNRPLNWHTDGYYNSPDQTIRAFVLHCVRPAVRGGTNEFIDPEVVYIRIRDQNPDYIRALMHPSAMSIPACRSDGVETRQGRGGPVFAIDPGYGSLHMRYTARTRSIHWREDRLTRDAVTLMVDVLSRSSPYRLRIRLRAGQGIVCNNVLHRRSAFTDNASSGRLLLRARYYERVRGPGAHTCIEG